MVETRAMKRRAAPASDKARKMARTNSSSTDDLTSSDSNGYSEALPAELCDMVIDYLFEDVASPTNPLAGLIGEDLFRPAVRATRMVSYKWNARVLASKRFSRRTAFFKHSRKSLDQLLALSRSEHAEYIEVLAFAMPYVDHDGHCPEMMRNRISPRMQYYEQVLDEVLPRFVNLQSIWIVGSSDAVKGEMVKPEARKTRTGNHRGSVYLPSGNRERGWMVSQYGRSDYINKFEVKELPARERFVENWVSRILRGENLPASLHMVFDNTNRGSLQQPKLFKVAHQKLRDSRDINCFVRTYSKARKGWGRMHPRIYKKTSDFCGDVTVLNVFRATEASVFSIKGTPDARFELDVYDRPTAFFPYVQLRKLHLAHVEVEAVELFYFGQCNAKGVLEEVHLDNLVVTSFLSRHYYSEFFRALESCPDLVNLRVTNLRYARVYAVQADNTHRIDEDFPALQSLINKVNQNRAAKGMMPMANITREAAFQTEHDAAWENLTDEMWPMV